MSSALSGCKIELDYEVWRSIYRRPPTVGRVVMVFDQVRNMVYLAALRVDEEGRRIWESMQPLKITSSYFDQEVIGWMPKEKFITRFKRLGRI